MFSGFKTPGPSITYLPEFTWINARFFNKKHVIKIQSPIEMFRVKLIMLVHYEHIIKQRKNRKYHLQTIFWG